MKWKWETYLSLLADVSMEGSMVYQEIKGEERDEEEEEEKSVDTNNPQHTPQFDSCRCHMLTLSVPCGKSHYSLNHGRVILL